MQPHSVLSRDAAVVARAIADEHGLAEELANAIAKTAVVALGLVPTQLRGQECGKPWSKEDTEYLTKHWATKTSLQLARDLGRNEESVRAKARYIRLPSKSGRRSNPRPPGPR